MKGIRQRQCMVCRNQKEKILYDTNPEIKARKLKQHRAYQQTSRIIIQQRIVDYLEEHPCIDCGEDDIRVLEFDHTDPEQKSISIGHAVRGGWGIAAFEREIAKCVVRCANCHRIKTQIQRGGWRSHL